MRKITALSIIALSSAFLSACSASSGAGLWCHLVPDAICMPSANSHIPQGSYNIEAADTKIILNGENVSLRPGVYKAKVTAKDAQGKVLGARTARYSLKNNVARIIHPAALKKWLRSYLRKSSAALQITSQKVPIIVTDPLAKSGTITEIVMYKETPVASSVGHIAPVKGCWYNETLCSDRD